MRDGREKLEHKLAQAITFYRQLAIEQRLARQEAEAVARRREEEQRILEARRDAADRQLSHLRKAEMLARQHTRAVRLRDYALALERTLEHTGDATAQEKKVAAEVAWLKHAADWLDPIVGASWSTVDGAPTPYWWFQYQREMGAD